MTHSFLRRLPGAFLCALTLSAVAAAGQTLPGAVAPATPLAGAQETPADALGRTTPRGTAFGFLGAGRRGDLAIARQYLNSGLNEKAAEELAEQLFIVLDARMPPTLMQVSDAPEGSRANPLEPDRERVATIAGHDGPLEIVLERVTRPRSAPVWLFSSQTLDAIPTVYNDVASRRARIPLPQFLLESRIGSVRLFEWITILLALTAMYLLTVLLNRLLTFVIVPAWRRLSGRAKITNRDVLPIPARLLIITIASRWIFTRLPVSLLVRQFLANVSVFVLIVSIAWLLILMNGVIERRVMRRISIGNRAAALSLLRVLRRMGDALVIFAAGIALLRRYGVDPTPVLAGLGVGGLAVALAAQKTLENVIAGASLIFDQALRVGDYLKVGTIEGTVDHIGLRSTRLRTPDRSIVSVPNGQIANMSLEILSDRDRFWFHPTLGLRYETTAAQLHTVIDGIREMLAADPTIDKTSLRVRLLRLGSFSMDVEVYAHVFARDWPHFLELQEQLLFRVIEIVAGAGAELALPSQTMYVARPPAADSV